MAKTTRMTRSSSLDPESVINQINEMELKKNTIDFKDPTHPLTKEYLQKVMAFQELIEILIKDFMREQAYLYTENEKRKEMQLAEIKAKAEYDAKRLLEILIMENLKNAKLEGRPSDRLAGFDNALMQEMLGLVKQTNDLRKQISHAQQQYLQAQNNANVVVNQVVANWQQRHQQAAQVAINQYVQGVQAFLQVKQANLVQVQACQVHKKKVVEIKHESSDVNADIIQLKRQIHQTDLYLDDKRDELDGKRVILTELQQQLVELEKATPKNKKHIDGVKDGISSIMDSISELETSVAKLEKKLAQENDELQKLLALQKECDEKLRLERAEVKKASGVNGEFDEDKHIVRDSKGRQVAPEELKRMIEEVMGARPTFAQAASAAVTFLQDLPKSNDPGIDQQMTTLGEKIKQSVSSVPFIPVLQPDVNRMVMQELLGAGAAMPTATTSGISSEASAASTPEMPMPPLVPEGDSPAKKQHQVATTLVKKNSLHAEIELLATLRTKLDASAAAGNDENTSDRLFAGFALGNVGSAAAAVTVLKHGCDQTHRDDVAGMSAILAAKKTEFITKRHYDDLQTQLTHAEEKLRVLRDAGLEQKREELRVNQQAAGPSNQAR